MPLQIHPNVRRSPHLGRVDLTLRRLPNYIYKVIGELEVECWVTPEPVAYQERRSGNHVNLKVGDSWGKLWDCAWFHFAGSVPESAKGEHAVLLIDFSGEGLVVDKDGNPVQGLTNVSSGYDFSLGRPGKRVVPVAKPSTGNETVDLWVDAGCNDLFGVLRDNGTLKEASIAIRRDDVHALYFDFEVLRELLEQLPKNKARYASVLNALYEASLFIKGDPSDEDVAKARARLAPELAKKGGDPSLTVSAVGHAHIDLAWLWPIRETIRKGARTFSTVLRMMERYPDYVFGESQPQLFQWIKDHYPSLYEEVKQKIKEGRWEVQGGFWVEPDANVPSGESLVRQILYGTRFFHDEFGIDVKNIWEPDVFGYSGSLPQIIKKSGLDTFLTQKLSWSMFNVHPYHTFHWEGIDGSSVLVHMPPEATYNSSAAPRAIAKAEDDYQEKGTSDRCLLLFGIGDGGGGPGEEHLERLAREKDLQGLCPVVQETASTFFERLKEHADRYPTWRGELYLEYHQGTLTSQARNKRYNRKMEFALRELEFSSAQAMLSSNQPYPSEELDRIWKEVLLYQFHDILPGSSITRVYDESLARYAILQSEVEELIAKADRVWIGAGLGVVNSLSWARTAWLKVEGTWRQVSAPPLGWAPMPGAEQDLPRIAATPEKLENEFLILAFNEVGELESIFDKENDREVVRLGECANELLVFEDPGDAWDFAPDYAELAPETCPIDSSRADVDGPEASLTQVRRFGQSTITQRIVLKAGSRRIDFDTLVDWKESGKMLRTRFPVDVQADTARCEIQFGSIERPTTQNTSWEAAKYEVCGQKWVDISERSYGVALLNDCKYGHNVRGCVMDLNLLRSPSYPDPVADRAEHHFTYSLFPHKGDHVEGQVVRQAYELNSPLRLVNDGTGGTQAPLVQIDSEDLVIETIKKAEDSEDLVVRLYEAHGGSVAARLRFGPKVLSATLTNLMETEESALPIDNNSVTIKAKPYEIITVKVRLGAWPS